MLGSLLAIATGLLWGFGIFSAGKASRTTSAPLLTALYNVCGFFLFSIIFLFSDEHISNANNVLLHTMGAGVLGGCGFAAGIVLITKGLSNGRAGIVGPLVATASVLIPFGYSIFTGKLPGSIAVVGIVILLAVPWFVAQSKHAPAHVSTTISRDTLFGTGSGLGFGMYYIALVITPSETQYLMLAIVQLVSAILLIGVHMYQKNSWRIARNVRGHILFFVFCELIAAIFLRIALNNGSPASVATLAAIFDPAALLVLARIFNKEIFSRYQLGGFVLMVAGVAMVVPNT